MEFIIPLFLLGILSLVAAAVAMRVTRTWARGRGAAIAGAFFLPGLYVAYLLGVTHLRDDYHSRQSETYDFDGNCFVALGHGYRLEYYDEFPEFSRITREGLGTAGNYLDDGSVVRLVENGVRRVGVTSVGVYGGASGRDDSPGLPVDHYFFVDFADGSNRRFRTESELRSAVPGIGPMNGADELFSMQENKERFRFVTWSIFLMPIIVVAFGWYRVVRRRSGTLNDDSRLVSGPLSG